MREKALAATCSKPAVLRDSPGDWANQSNVGKDVRTCAVCYYLGKEGVTLGCIAWSHYTNGAGLISFLPAAPEATCDAADLDAAAKRWNKLPGNMSELAHYALTACSRFCMSLMTSFATPFGTGSFS